MSSTLEYIKALESLKDGHLGLLRAHAGVDLDESVHAFDLFTGLWWPLREKSQRAPRREVAWLVAKLYASCALKHQQGPTLPERWRACRPRFEHGISRDQYQRALERHRQQFDALLLTPLGEMEPVLRLLLVQIADTCLKCGWNRTLDWVHLTDKLSIWERTATREEWAREYLALEQQTTE